MCCEELISDDVATTFLTIPNLRLRIDERLLWALSRN
jgi:hypothetical protein